MRKSMCSMLLIGSIAFIASGLTACDKAGDKNNPLLQVLVIDKDYPEDSYKIAGHYLTYSAMRVQPQINEQFNVKYKNADFYIACMDEKTTEKAACKALYDAMARDAKVEGKPNILRKQSYVDITSANISSKKMWPILSFYVKDVNN